MKISELEAKLKEIREEHGDLSVALYNPEYNCFENIVSVDFINRVMNGSYAQFDRDKIPNEIAGILW